MKKIKSYDLKSGNKFLCKCAGGWKVADYYAVGAKSYHEGWSKTDNRKELLADARKTFPNAEWVRSETDLAG